MTMSNEQVLDEVITQCDQMKAQAAVMRSKLKIAEGGRHIPASHLQMACDRIIGELERIKSRSEAAVQKRAKR